MESTFYNKLKKCCFDLLFPHFIFFLAWGIVMSQKSLDSFVYKCYIMLPRVSTFLD